MYFVDSLELFVCKFSNFWWGVLDPMNREKSVKWLSFYILRIIAVESHRYSNSWTIGQFSFAWNAENQWDFCPYFSSWQHSDPFCLFGKLKATHSTDTVTYTLRNYMRLSFVWRKLKKKNTNETQPISIHVYKKSKQLPFTLPFSFPQNFQLLCWMYQSYTRTRYLYLHLITRLIGMNCAYLDSTITE